MPKKFADPSSASKEGFSSPQTSRMIDRSATLIFPNSRAGILEVLRLYVKPSKATRTCSSTLTPSHIAQSHCVLFNQNHAVLGVLVVQNSFMTFRRLSQRMSRSNSCRGRYFEASILHRNMSAYSRNELVRLLPRKMEQSTIRALNAFTCVTVIHKKLLKPPRHAANKPQRAAVMNHCHMPTANNLWR